MQARIYRRSKSAMQSGRGKVHDWVLEYELATPRRPEPLMGWVASGDTLNQVQLTFPSKEEAIAFAERKSLAYSVLPEQERRVVPRNYADNFRPRPR
ncbi:ETC complex I subunit [Inquilinus sp. Marseille-Q2685]|uniref:ETC complex I subunit n=1 Tax=Inquilinus sp. Marseille-Q2685 TaxID=2866581 RepID=UPI001CE42608|nr:ETC complex I subunit [Inquilinus sp. Marseille-Q2685]